MAAGTVAMAASEAAEREAMRAAKGSADALAVVAVAVSARVARECVSPRPAAAGGREASAGGVGDANAANGRAASVRGCRANAARGRAREVNEHAASGRAQPAFA